MKRSLCMMMAVIMLAVAMVFVPATGLAAADVKLAATPSATELEAAGEVTLNIKITNAGSEITDAVLKVNGAEAGTVGTVAAGAESSKTVKFNVADADFGKDIPVTLSYKCEGADGTATASFKIAKKTAGEQPAAPGEQPAAPGEPAEDPDEPAEVPTISVKSTSSVDKTVVPYDSKVNFTFVITNDGNVAIEKCVLKAKTLKSGKQITDTFTLAPGEKKTVNYQGTIIKSIEVAPKLTYVAGGKAGEHALDKLNITMSNAVLDVAVTSSAVESDGTTPVTFALSVKNSGNSVIKNITATGYNGEAVALSLTELKAGESTSGTQEAVITADAEVVFNVTGVSDTGETVKFQSNSIAVTYVEPVPEATPEPTPEPKPEDYLLLTATTDTPEMEKKGSVIIAIKLINSSEQTYGPLTLSEKVLGDISTIDELPPGEVSTQIEVPVSETTNFVFTVTGKDANGDDVTVSASPLAIKFPEKGIKNALGGMLWVLIAIIVLIIGTATALIILLIKDKKNKAMLAEGEGEEKQEEEAPARRRREPAPEAAEPARAPQRRMKQEDLTIEDAPAAAPVAPTVVRRPAEVPAVRGKKEKVKEIVDRNCF